MNKKYDAFLSHNSKDKLTVEEIGRRLEEKGKVKIWIDKWNLIPGDPWEEEIENALDESNCCILFLGPNGIGTWQHKEMESTLKRMLSTKAIRIIPVLLPGANRPEMESKLPPFLRQVTWVIFRFNLDEPDAFSDLVCGIKKIKPGKRSKDKKSAIIPFMGLRNFREEDASFFFGRDYEIQQLMNKLGKSRFLAVLGPSGSGKSSLVQAGLIPHLRENSLVCMMTPRERPFEELAAALCRCDQENKQFTIEEVVNHLKESQDNFYNTAIEILKNQNKKNFYIIIDQFEELFTQTKTEEERREFIYILLNVLDVHDGPVNIIIAIRSDFLGKCVYYSELNIYIMDHLFQVGPINDDKLIDVIEIPARTVGIYFEKGLVVKILKDIKGVTIELPLLAHALLELYNRRVENILTLKSYEEIGGIEGSLVKIAEEEYQKLDEIEKEILRKMFALHLIQPGEGTEDTRRKVPEAELLKIGSDPGVVQGLIDKWINKRFLIKSFDTYRKQNLVEIAHEAIINKWNKITSWMAEDREAARRMGILRLEALKWQNSGLKQEYLFQGTRLIEMEELFKFHYEDIDQISVEFLESSIILRNQKDQERKTRQKRKLLIVSGFAFIIFLALLISLNFLFRLKEKDIKLRTVTTSNLVDNNFQMAKQNQLLNSFHTLAYTLNINPDSKFDKTLLLSMNRYWHSPLLTNIFQLTLPIRGAIFYSEGTKIRFFLISSG